MNKQMKELREGIEKTLNDEKEALESFGDSVDAGQAPSMYNCEGWIEALEYVLHQMDALDGGARDLLSTQEYRARWLETHEDE